MSDSREHTHTLVPLGEIAISCNMHRLQPQIPNSQRIFVIAIVESVFTFLYRNVFFSFSNSTKTPTSS